RRHRERTLDRQSCRCAGHRAMRRMGRLRGTVPQLRPTLDRQCGRRLSCAACGDGTDFGGSWPIRADRRTRGGDGGWATVGRRHRGRLQPAGALRRVPQGRNPCRSEPMVGNQGQRKGSRMIRKAPLILLGAAAGAALTLLATQPRLALVGASARAAGADTYRQLNLFGDVFERVRADYVEKPDDGKLIESAINGMLNALDPHSSYMDAKSFRDMQVQTRGEFGGLGIEVTMEDGLVKVVAPIDDTP